MHTHLTPEDKLIRYMASPRGRVMVSRIAAAAITLMIANMISAYPALEARSAALATSTHLY